MSTQRTKTPATATALPLAPVHNTPVTMAGIWGAVLAAPQMVPVLAAVGGRENLDAGVAAAMPLITAAIAAAIAAAITGADQAQTRTAAIAAVMPLLPSVIAEVARVVTTAPLGVARATTGIQKVWIADELLQEAVDAALAHGEGDDALEAFVAALSLGIGADAPLEPMVQADAALAASTGRHHLLEAFVVSNLRKAVTEMATPA